MRVNSISVVDVRRWNDTFAREYNIDAYYTEASVLVRWVTRRRLRAVKRLVDARAGDRILEVGCGGGHILRMFPANKLVGIDVSGEMIQKSERNLRLFDIELHRGELHEVPLGERRFARIICSEVLEHVVDPSSLIAGMANLLAPGGRLVVTIPNDRWIDAIKGVIRKSGLHHIPPFRNITWGGDHYHLHTWTKKEMWDELSQHLSVERVAVEPSALFPLHYAFACQRITRQD